MDLDTNKVRELLDKRDDLDLEIAALITGTKERKAIVCGSCGQPGHSSRTCGQRKKGENGEV